MRTSIATGALAILLSAAAAVGVFYLLDHSRSDDVSAADVSTEEDQQQAPAAFDQEWAPEPEAYEALTQRGGEVYAANCFVCHGGVGNGEGSVGADPVDARP